MEKQRETKERPRERERREVERGRNRQRRKRDSERENTPPDRIVTYFEFTFNNQSTAVKQVLILQTKRLIRGIGTCHFMFEEDLKEMKLNEPGTEPPGSGERGGRDYA